MRGGKTKSIEQHLQDGTYRHDRHSSIEPSDETTIIEMKNELYNAFLATTKKIKVTDIDKNPESYKLLNDIMINQIKAFHGIAKVPIIKNQNKEIEDKDGFKK